MEKNHWNGKLWYAYGTSMTSVEVGKFVPVVEELSGMTVVNLGSGGGCLTPDGYSKGKNKRILMNPEDGKEKADLITLEVLPNEGETVGSIYDTDDESFCGCLNQCIRYLQENTKAQIVVIIMIMGNDKSPETISKRGITDFEFAEIAERVAHLNGVPVINAFAESGDRSSNSLSSILVKISGKSLISIVSFCLFIFVPTASNSKLSCVKISFNTIPVSVYLCTL